MSHFCASLRPSAAKHLVQPQGGMCDRKREVVIIVITPPRMGGWMGSVSTLGVLCALSFRFRRNHPPLKHHSAQIYDAPQ